MLAAHATAGRRQQDIITRAASILLNLLTSALIVRVDECKPAEFRLWTIFCRQSFDIRRCISKKYRARTTKREPLPIMIRGAEVRLIKKPASRLPMGIPPRNETLYTLMTRPRIASV